MPLQKVLINPGVNREMTRYAAEGGGMTAIKYGSDKARLRDRWVGTNFFVYLFRRSSVPTQLDHAQQPEPPRRRHKHQVLYRPGRCLLRHYPQPCHNRAGGVHFPRPTAATITATSASHAASEGDYVTFSNCTGLGGNITADVLNQDTRSSASLMQTALPLRPVRRARRWIAVQASFG